MDPVAESVPIGKREAPDALRAEGAAKRALPDAAVVLPRLGCRASDRFCKADLLSIDDLEAPLFVVENHGLPVGADHQVIGVRHDKGLLIAEHNPNRSKGLSVHQFFDLVCDHALESSRRPPAKANGFFSSFTFGRTAISLALGDVRKEGPSFDLPIALRARAEGKVGVLVPPESAAEAAVVSGLQVIPVHNLREKQVTLSRRHFHVHRLCQTCEGASAVWSGRAGGGSTFRAGVRVASRRCSWSAT